jgi:REP element-mobilizing transposase RayT
MTRKKRTLVPGSLVHVISRFVNRDFRIQSPLERREFLRRVGKHVPRTDWRLLALTPMSSHIHLAVIAGSIEFREFISPIHSGFAGWLNRRHGRIGPVFADRPKTINVDPAHAFRLIAYLHNNPVRANICSSPEESDWSTHRYYAGLEPAPRWLDVSLGLRLAGFENSPQERQEFHEGVCAQLFSPRDPMLSGDHLSGFRNRARRELGSAIEIDYPSLTRDRNLICAPRLGPDGRLVERWSGAVADLCHCVCVKLGIDGRRLLSRDRTRTIARGRRLVVLVGRELGLETSRLAAYLEISSPVASRYAANAMPDDAALARELAAGIRTKVKS